MTALTIDPADVLNGYEEVAAFYRITVRQAKHQAAIGAIPIYKVGHLVRARRSSCLAAMAAAEARGLHKGKGRTEHEAEPERAA